MADGSVAQDDPTVNFGTTSVLETDGVPVVESYLKFLVGDVTGPVRSAKLRAYVVNGSPNGPAVYTTGVEWSETGLTWSNKPARTSAALDDKGGVSAGTWVEWDVTTAVRGNDLYSFNLATTSNDGTDVASREAATDRRPRLVVTFEGQAAPDTTAPDTVIESAPIGTVLVDNATFRFYATEGGATFACRLDSGSWAPCSSPHRLEGLSNGNHLFAVRATDAAGNTDPLPAEYAFTVAVVDIRQARLAPDSGAHFGAHVQAADRTQATVSAAVGQVEAAIDRPLAIDMWYEPWANVFPTWREQWDFAAGRIPMISWGKWYTDQIARGDHDAYIAARADGIKALGQPVMIRWFWEMDGSRNAAYAVSPASFIEAWRHIVGIFRERGATNVDWVWCPNASGFNNGEAQAWYPGDAWVDWLCADGYNFYPERNDNRSFETTFASFYSWARQRPKPIVIGEYGALQAGPGERAAWIDAARATVKTTMPRILGLCWFHSVHEHDWTLLSEPSAIDAFRRMALDPYFNPPG
ncbi:MAG: DNRLRE domain-containing protein [Actinomycetota bacterium]